MKSTARALLALLICVAAPALADAATERLSPDAITASSSLSGAVAAIQDDPDSPDSSFLPNSGAINAATAVTVSFPTRCSRMNHRTRSLEGFAS